MGLGLRSSSERGQGRGRKGHGHVGAWTIRLVDVEWQRSGQRRRGSNGYGDLGKWKVHFLESAADRIGQQFELVLRLDSEGARFAGKDLDDADNALIASNRGDHHGADSKFAADFAVDPGILLRIVSAETLAQANTLAGNS
ncbi:MAG TPA: hypothetical protein VGF59_24460 [Bryobacteraceae bacterium]